MIFEDSYQTTIGSAFDVKQILVSIKEAIIKDGLNRNNLNVCNDGNFKPLFITGGLPSESNIPLFTHPIILFNFNHENYLCTDLRLYVRKDSDINEIEKSIKNLTEYNFVKSRTILNLVWLNDGINDIKNSLYFASTIFSAWLSETISKSFALDYKDQTTIAIITSYYYQTLFMDNNTFDESSIQKMAVHTIKATKAPSELVFQIFEKITNMTDANSYCENIVNIVENVRLKNFNLAVLLTIVKNSWYGTNAKEILSVSIEHPPTWIAIVYASLSERTYKNSSIYRIAERFGKRGASDEFINGYKRLVKDNLNVAREELVLRPYE
jgi:hypothetical protein